MRHMLRAPRGVGLALGLTLLAACPRHEEVTTPAVLTGQAAAGEGPRHLLGTERYELSAHQGGASNVVLRDAQGHSQGSLVLAGGEGTDTSAVLILADGSRATWHGFLVQEGTDSVRTRSRLEADGQALEVDVLEGDDHAVRRVMFGAAPGPSASAISSVRGDGPGYTLVVQEEGQAVEGSTVEAWLAAADLDRLLVNPAARALYVLVSDPGLADALFALRNPAPPAQPLVQGIHKSFECANRSTLIGTSVAACVACVGSIATATVTSGLSVLLALPSCLLCGAHVGAALTLHARCVQSQKEARTQAECNEFCQKSMGSAYTASVPANEHSPCICTCDAKRCADLLQSRIGYGQTLCSTNKCVDNDCAGVVQTCGNGIIESLEGCTPEECDPEAQPSGCPSGKSCNGHCRCLDNPEPTPDPPDAGQSEQPDAGFVTDCSHVTCDQGNVCLMCGTRPYCGPSGSSCCGDGVCDPGMTCTSCGDGQFCMRPGETCCNPMPGVFFTCSPGLLCCPGRAPCFNTCPAP